MATKEQTQIKKQKLRNNEYYDTQKIFDDLYAKSKDGKKFTDLMSIIISENNINQTKTKAKLKWQKK